MPMVGEKFYDHHHHEHPLIYETFELGMEYDCSGCRELGLRSGYSCEHKDCEFVLHEPCFKKFGNKFHFIWFPECEFEFVSKLVSGPTKCDICTKPINGYAYKSCTHDNVNIHPQCSTLPQRTNITIGNEPMKLVREIKSDCNVCHTKRLSGVRNSWAYISTRSSLQVHVSCFHKLENISKKDNSLKKEKVTGKGTPVALPKSSSNSKPSARHNSTPIVPLKQNQPMEKAMDSPGRIAAVDPLKAFVFFGMMIAIIISIFINQKNHHY